MDIKPEILSFEHSSFPTKRKERGIRKNSKTLQKQTEASKIN
jgi:hypothetical protein